MSENADSSDATYTVRLNNKLYALNEDARDAIAQRAELEYQKNPVFSCWWKVADPDQYEDGMWERTIHEEGDAVLVIETEGVMVPWENLDQMEVEMDVFDFYSLSKDNDASHDNGMKSVEPERDDADAIEGRTHFPFLPRNYEEVPMPETDRLDKIPVKPDKANKDPSMVVWAPEHPDITHTWAAGEAMVPIASRVEWNVQRRADQPRIYDRKTDSHDHWESILKMHECPVVGKLSTKQKPPSRDVADRESESRFTDGIAGGDNWHV